MKILRIIPSINPKDGGVAEAVRLSTSIFKDTEIDIEVLCFDNPNSTWLKDFPSKVYALGSGVSSYHLSFKYIQWLIKNVQNYDLVIIDGIWQFHVFGGYICKLKNIPYCVYIHGMLDPYFTKFKLKHIKKLPFWFLIERNVIHIAQYTIFTCEDEQLICKTFPFMKFNPIIITLGIEEINKDKHILKNAFLEKFDISTDKKLALYLSRIHVKKGIDILIDAVYENKDILKKFIFLIAGTGDKKLEVELKDKIKALNIDKNFLWLGHISGDVKWGAFNIADFFILPSHSENFGIVVAESLSQSTPVLTTNKVNIWREIDKYNAGFVSDDTQEGISNSLKSYISLTQEEKKVMEQNALSCFNNAFSIDAFKNDFYNLIKKCEK